MASVPMRVVIGGGTGFIGTTLTRTLVREGYDVTLVSRSPGKSKMTWNDLYRLGLPDDTYAVVNLAGENLMNPKRRWNEEFKRQLHSSRIQTTKDFVRAIKDAHNKPKVFVSSSAVGFYRPSPTVEYTEDSPGGDFDFLSQLCSEWEKSAELPADSGVRQATVRIGIALGRNGGTIQNLIMPFFLGVGGKIASGKQWFPWIHVQDVAGIITHAIGNNNVSGVLNATAPNPVTNEQFSTAFAKAMWRPCLFPVPAFALNTVFGAERAKAMVEGQKVLPKRTLESGYKFIYPEIQEACYEFSHLVPSSDDLRA